MLKKTKKSKKSVKKPVKRVAKMPVDDEAPVLLTYECGNCQMLEKKLEEMNQKLGEAIADAAYWERQSNRRR